MLKNKKDRVQNIISSNKINYLIKISGFLT